MSYWQNVIRDAAIDMARPLQWTKQRIVSTAAVVVGTLLVGGISALIDLINTSAVAISGTVILAALLFLWSIFHTQWRMYRDLETITSAKINVLTAKLETFQRPLPDYESWKHKEIITLKDAAQLWCGERPGIALSGEAGEKLQMLIGAIQSGELDFMPHLEMTSPHLRSDAMIFQRKNADGDTKVSRAQLTAFCKLHSYYPTFLTC